MLNNHASSEVQKPVPEKKFFYGNRRGERSFSLLETIIAVSLVAILMVEVSGVNGNAIAFNEYGRKVLQASYLAKRIMSQIEYQATFRSPLKDMANNEKDKPFEDAPEFSYSVTIESLPHALDLMFKIFSGGMVGGKDKEDGKDGGKDGMGAMLDQIKTVITQSVGEDPIWIAKVEVTWPEGARRASTSVAMIITDIKKLEDSVGKILDQAPAGGGGGPGSVPGGVPPGPPGGAPPPAGGGVGIPPGGGLPPGGVVP